jgi:hypothetical protein
MRRSLESIYARARWRDPSAKKGLVAIDVIGVAFVLGFEEGIQFPVRITLKKLYPSFQPLGA